MSYLRVRNFWEYQNADAWKKAKKNKGGHRHPAWCKLFVHRDMELDALAPVTRLVFYEMLKLATTCENAIPNETQALVNAMSLPRKEVTQAIAGLLKGGWLQETRTPRRSREPSRKHRESFGTRTEQIREEKDPALAEGRNGDIKVERELAIARLLASLKDKDENTHLVVRGIVSNGQLAVGDIEWARECAGGPGVISQTRVAVAELKKRGVSRAP